MCIYKYIIYTGSARTAASTICRIILKWRRLIQGEGYASHSRPA